MKCNRKSRDNYRGIYRPEKERAAQALPYKDSPTYTNAVHIYYKVMCQVPRSKISYHSLKMSFQFCPGNENPREAVSPRG